MHIKYRYFSRKNLETGGENHPQMPLIVNIDSSLLEATYWNDVMMV